MTPVGAVGTKDRIGAKVRGTVLTAGLRARLSDLDPIHVHHMGPRWINCRISEAGHMTVP